MFLSSNICPYLKKSKEYIIHRLCYYVNLCAQREFRILNMAANLCGESALALEKITNQELFRCRYCPSLTLCLIKAEALFAGWIGRSRQMNE